MAVEYPVSRGSCAAYFPEASVLIALEYFDPHSRTPAYKSVPVEVERIATCCRARIAASTRESCIDPVR